MPCNCDHLEPTAREAESVKILEFLRELSGMPYDHQHPHGDCYGRVETLDKDVAGLCDLCQQLGKKIKKCSLELQMWWRDHQEVDRKKAVSAAERTKTEKLARSALKKLIPAERKALGL